MENHNQNTKLTKWLAATIVVMMSCQNGANLNSNNDSLQQATDTAKSITINSGTHCFAYLNNNDSVLLSLTINGKWATGKLLYALYEKDKNEGSIKGQFYGDTLLADYTFFSEGVRSVRQVVFLRKGNVFQEGYGSMKENNGRLLFSHLSEIYFTGNVLLLPVDCKRFDKKW